MDKIKELRAKIEENLAATSVVGMGVGNLWRGMCHRVATWGADLRERGGGRPT